MGKLHEILRYPLFAIGGTPVDLGTILTAVVVGLISLWLAHLLEKGIAEFLRRKGMKDEGSIGATSRLAYYVVLGVGSAIAIHTLGINLTALFTAGAIFAIALGFAMQNITQNFMAGLILLVERTIKPGDILEVEGRMVKVTSLGLRATVTRTWDADDFIIPNSVLVASTVKNFTLRDRMHRIRTTVGVSYDSDMRHVRQILEETTRNLPWRLQTANPVVLMKLFGNSSVDFDVSVYVDDPYGRSVCQSNLNEAVWFALKDAGITIAYPQLDLHLDRKALDAMRASD